MTINMKRFVLTLFVVMSYILAFGAKYEVKVNSELNVRQKPSASSVIIAKLKNGEIIDCTPVAGNDEWMEIEIKSDMADSKIGYVKASFIQPVSDKTPHVVSEETAMGQFLNRLLHTDGNGSRSLVYLILSEILVMWFVSKWIRKVSPNMFEYKGFDGAGWRYFSIVWLLITSFTIFFYLKEMGMNALWFIQPSIMNNWWKVIFNFIVFIYVLINLFVFFLKTMDDLSMTFRGSVNILVGLIGWGIGIIGFLFAYWFKDEWLDYVIWIVAAIQMIQFVIMAYHLWHGGGIIGILISFFVYIVGALSIVFIAVPIVAVAIILMIIGIVICAICNGDSCSQPNTSLSWEESNGTVFSSAQGKYIVDGNGDHHWVWGEHGDMLDDDKGHSWYSPSGMSARRYE